MTALPIDPRFPQIGRLLDSGFMRTTLQSAFFLTGPDEAQIKIIDCRIGEKRHKPGRSFRLTYELMLEDQKNGRRHEQIVSAEAGRKEPQSSRSSQLSSLAIKPFCYLPELDASFWLFPHDRKLKHLAELQKSGFLNTYFYRHARHINLVAEQRIEDIDLKVMHYLPARSCMTRYRLSIANQSGAGRERELIIYGKTYGDGSGEAVFSVMKQLAAQIENCARPLFYDPEFLTLWQAHAEGAPFSWEHTRAAESHSVLKAIAQAIASFHRSSIKVDKRFDIHQINAQLESCYEIAKSTYPVLADEVKDAVEMLRSSHQEINWNSAAEAPIHMDLKMGNLLISGDKVSLIDLDEVCLGDPLADFGSFIANVYMNGLCAGAEMAEIETVAETLIRHYSAAIGQNFDRIRLNWHLSAAFIHEVLRRSLRQQNELRLRHLNKYLELSRRYCPAVERNKAANYG